MDTLTVDATYFDTNLARDRRQFAEDCAIRCHRSLEHELEEVDGPNFHEKAATGPQKILMTMHTDHVVRLCKLLAKLPALRHITLTDGAVRKLSQGSQQLLQDGSKTWVIALLPSEWRGTYTTAYATKPPVELFGELFSKLGETGIRLKSLRVNLTVPADLRGPRVTDKQALGIRALVTNTSVMHLDFWSWARRESHGEDNVRPPDEMRALGSITVPLTSTQALRELSVTFEGYPALFSGVPTVGMTDLLALRDGKWSKLRRLALNHLPCELEDFELLVKSCRITLESFAGDGLFLRTSDWPECLDMLRELDALQDFTLFRPLGGRYGDGSGLSLAVHPDEAVQDYVLKRRLLNPLRDGVRTRGSIA